MEDERSEGDAGPAYKPVTHRATRVQLRQGGLG